MPKFTTGDKVTVIDADKQADIDPIETPSSATAEDCAEKINEILAALKTVVE